MVTLLHDLVRANTAIDAGHYSILGGPTELDCYLFEQGAKLYTFAKQNYGKAGLFLLVDDVSGVAKAAEERNISGNDFRRSLDISNIPLPYIEILTKYAINDQELRIVSQDRMREKGRQLCREAEMARMGRTCPRIVASYDRMKEKKGFSNVVGLYDSEKTDNGEKLHAGGVFGRTFFGTKVEIHYRVFRDKATYRDIHFRAVG